MASRGITKVDLELGVVELVLDSIAGDAMEQSVRQKHAFRVVHGDVAWRVVAVVGSDTDSINLAHER